MPPTLQTLLVATDFSPHADAALDAALDLAGEGTTLHLLHTYMMPAGGMQPYGIALPDHLLGDIRDAAARQLEKVVNKVRAAGVACETHLLSGSPAEAIVETAGSVEADLVVVGTRGLTGLKHVLLGSVAERLVRLAPCPVLAVHEEARLASPLQRVVVATDFSDHSTQAVAVAVNLARQDSATLHLVHACELPASVTMAYDIAIPETVWQQVQQTARDRMDALVSSTEAAGASEVLGHLVTGPASDAVLEVAKTENADVIVLGTRGLTGIKHILLGSVAERTLRSAACPVLVVPVQ